MPLLQQLHRALVSPSNIARARSASPRHKAGLSRVHHEEVELAKGVRGD